MEIETDQEYKRQHAIKVDTITIQGQACALSAQLVSINKERTDIVCYHKDYY